MIDRDFCAFLEYEICKAIKSSSIEQIKGFWCDGIMTNQAEINYSMNFVIRTKEIKLKAFIGCDEQGEYELRLKLGDKALLHYSNSLSLIECVPNPEKEGWFKIDILEKTMEIKLD